MRARDGRLGFLLLATSPWNILVDADLIVQNTTLDTMFEIKEAVTVPHSTPRAPRAYFRTRNAFSVLAAGLAEHERAVPAQEHE